MLLASAGVLDFNGHSPVIDHLVLSVGDTVTTGAGAARLVVGDTLGVEGLEIGAATVKGNVDLNGGMPSLGSASANSLIIEGPISNGGARYFGLVMLRGAANTYTGLSEVPVGGIVRLEKPGLDAAFRGDVTIRGSVHLEANEQILAAPGNEVFIDGGNLFLDTFTETIQDLTLQNAGVIHGSSGNLAVLGTIRASVGIAGIFPALNLNGARVFNVEGSARLTIQAQLSNGSLNKQGTGTLHLENAANSFAGGTFLNGGTLSAISDSALGNPAGGLHFDGGIFSGNFTTNRTITWGPNGGGFAVPSINIAMTLPTQSLTGPGPLTKLERGTLVLLAPQSYTGGTTVADGTLEGNTQSLQGNIVTQAAGTVAFNVATDGTYAGNLSGAGGLTKAGAGLLLLSGTNPYGGPTTINAGRLRLGNSNAMGIQSAVTLANVAGAILDLNGNNIVVGSLAGGGTSGGNVDLGSGNLTTGGNNTDTTFAGVISGTGGVTKTGSSTWTLTGNNTYSGGMTFAGGVTSASSDPNLGDIAAPLHFDGGTLRVTGAFNTTPRSVELLAGGGGLDIANTANSFTYSGNITGPGGLTKTGIGSLILEGNNSYGGPTAVNAGTLRRSAATPSPTARR